MRLLNTVFILVMLIIFGYLWTIKGDDLASLPFLGMALFSAINELDYKIDDLLKRNKRGE